MHELITDKSFDLNKTNEYKLSIQISLDGFSFFIVTAENNLVAFKNSSLKISNENFIARRFEEWAQTEELLQKNYRHIEVVFFTKKFTLIPEKYFSRERLSTVFQQLFGKAANEQIVENYNEQFQHHLCFAMPQLFYNQIRQNFESCDFLHPAHLLSKLCSGLNFKNFGLLLLFGENKFYFLLSDGNHILLANNYSFVHVNDVVYYVLAALNALEIPAQKTQVYLAGITKPYDETEANLAVYFKEIEYLKPKSAVNFNSDIFDFGTHRFVALLA